jgi:hypothetical protein
MLGREQMHARRKRAGVHVKLFLFLRFSYYSLQESEKYLKSEVTPVLAILVAQAELQRPEDLKQWMIRALAS